MHISTHCVDKCKMDQAQIITISFIYEDCCPIKTGA